MIKRLRDLIIKYISVKGSIFLIATVLMFLGKMDVLIWGLTALAFTSMRMFEKILMKIVNEKNN